MVLRLERFLPETVTNDLVFFLGSEKENSPCECSVLANKPITFPYDPLYNIF